MANSLLEKQISSKVDWSKAQIETSEIDPRKLLQKSKRQMLLAKAYKHTTFIRKAISK